MLDNSYKPKIAIVYLVLLLFNYALFYGNGVLLSQRSPILFYNRLDLTVNLVLLSNIQQAIFTNYWLCLLFDSLFLFLPIGLAAVITFNVRGLKELTIVTALYCFVYGIFLALFSTISLEFFIPYLFLPLVFYPASEKGFYYVFHCIRILFILFFLSAGLWKLRTGAVFNTEQMSGILLYQHKQLLVANPLGCYAKCIMYLINHQLFSYLLYLLGVALELIFVIGLFTKKYDKLLLYSLVLFVVMDYAIMQINYSSWLCFIPLFYFSKHKLNNL